MKERKESSSPAPLELAGYYRQRSLRWGLVVGLLVAGSSLVLLPQMSNPAAGLSLAVMLGLTAGIIVSRSVRANEIKPK